MIKELKYAFLFIVVLALIAVALVGYAQNNNMCDFYRYASLKDVPVSCINYLTK
jgi:hypothetical protein